MFTDTFERIISLENLFSAWESFHVGKQYKPDVLEFEWNMEANLFQLHRRLKAKTYSHGPYASFYIHDPKQRHIHKATVQDRVLHHAIFNVLNPIFEPTFISNSFSCREKKGTHKGVEALAGMSRQVSHNGTRSCFALKSDIQKFFFRVDHEILLRVLRKKVKEEDTMWLLENVIRSFSSSTTEAKGLPIGNLTSQLFANVYMNEFDQFVKHGLRVKRYARYTDDFVILSNDRAYLTGLLQPMQVFLDERLALQLHPKKTEIRKLGQGIDFLGYVIFPHYRLVRTRTKQRMMRKLKERVMEYRSGGIPKEKLEQSLQSYHGVLTHADSYHLGEQMRNNLWFWLNG